MLRRVGNGLVERDVGGEDRGQIRLALGRVYTGRGCPPYLGQWELSPLEPAYGT